MDVIEKKQVIFLAIGYDYLVMATNAATTVRLSGTTASIKLITNFRLSSVRHEGAVVFDEIEFVDIAAEDNRWVKTRIARMATHERNVLLDCDLEVRSSLNPIFDLLENFDVIARNLPFETKTDFSLKEQTVKTLAMSEINTGVIFFSDSDEAGEILDAWHTNFIEVGVSRDQPAFLRALLTSKKARFLPLPPMWNATPFKKVDLAQMKADPDKIKILHYRDPVFWPSIAPKLAKIHGGAEFSLIAPDVSFEKARQQYEPLARLYSSRLFQYLLGRYALDVISRYLLRGRGRLKKIDSRRAPEKGGEL